jgi:very-short-patch-repair endonuclease
MSNKAKLKKRVPYLTEASLAKKLQEIFPGERFVRDKVVPKSGVKTRPDYRSNNLKLIVEYDGPNHYCQARRIIKDLRKRTRYQEMGFKVVRIPYFVQLKSETIRLLFGVEKQVHENFPHGFIIKTVKLPADFCELGIRVFAEDLSRFECIRQPIIQSLKNKVDALQDVDLVMPPSLDYLLSE